MFSIVIPIFNKATYIEKAIVSILTQTEQNFEIIIVDDGSTDDSKKKVSNMVDPRIKILTQPNLGVSIARNNGVKAANFENIVFLDADDWWDPCFLEEMNKLITLFPDAALYGSNYYIVKNNINNPAQVGVGGSFQMGYINYFSVYSNTYFVPINCSFVVVKKWAFEQVGGFNPKLKFGEDFDLWVRLALLFKVAYINQFLAYSNQDVDVSNRALGSGKVWKKEEHIIFNLEYIDKHAEKNSALKYLLDGLKLRLLIDFYLRGDYTTDVKKILSKVTFEDHSYYYQFVFYWPKPLVRFYFTLIHYASIVKQNLLAMQRRLISSR